MNWESLGIPSIVVLFSGGVFIWYNRITKASIENLNLIIKRLEGENKSLFRKLEDQEKKFSKLEELYLNDQEKQQESRSEKERDALIEKEKILKMINLFDRRSLASISAFGRMENASIPGGTDLMCMSLNELRIQMQENGMLTLKDKSAKKVFNEIRNSIYDIFSIIYTISLQAPKTLSNENLIIPISTKELIKISQPLMLTDIQKGVLSDNFKDVRCYFSARIKGKVSEEEFYINNEELCSKKISQLKQSDIDIITYNLACVYGFGAIDNARRNIKSNIDLLIEQYAN